MFDGIRDVSSSEIEQQAIKITLEALRYLNKYDIINSFLPIYEINNIFFIFLKFFFRKLSIYTTTGIKLFIDLVMIIKGTTKKMI